mgnify:CR=1 FL=1
MPKVMIDVSATCRECGRDLDINVDYTRDGDLIISVAPCTRCLDGAREEGSEAGRKEAEAEAEE